MVLQAQKGNIYFTELDERVEYGDYAHRAPDRLRGRSDNNDNNDNDDSNIYVIIVRIMTMITFVTAGERSPPLDWMSVVFTIKISMLSSARYFDYIYACNIKYNRK